LYTEDPTGSKIIPQTAYNIKVCPTSISDQKMDININNMTGHGIEMQYESINCQYGVVFHAEIPKDKSRKVNSPKNAVWHITVDNTNHIFHMQENWTSPAGYTQPGDDGQGNPNPTFGAVLNLCVYIDDNNAIDVKYCMSRMDYQMLTGETATH
jgi:hypothetical protein